MSPHYLLYGLDLIETSRPDCSALQRSMYPDHGLQTFGLGSRVVLGRNQLYPVGVAELTFGDARLRHAQQPPRLARSPIALDS